MVSQPLEPEARYKSDASDMTRCPLFLLHYLEHPGKPDGDETEAPPSSPGKQYFGF